MWFAMAIVAMLFWSGSDLFSKMGSEQKDKYSHYKVGIAVGFVMGIHALYMLTFGGVTLAFTDVVQYLPASALYILSMLIGYIGLRYIELSISSPICNSSGAIVLIMSMLIYGVSWGEENGDRIVMNAPTLIGVVLIVVGVVLLGFVNFREDEEARAARQMASNRKYSRSALAIALPVLYCVLDALGTFVDDLIAGNYIEGLVESGLDEVTASDIAGDRLNTAYELTWLLMAVIFFIYVFIIKKEKIRTPSNAIKGIGGICETAGQVFYMAVIVSTDPNAVIGLVIISSYCALSFVWSHIFLKEKLSVWHYITIAMTFVGILTLGILDPG